MFKHIQALALGMALALTLPSLTAADVHIEPFTPSDHSTVEQIVVKQAEVYGTPATPIIATMRCESGLDPTATNHTAKEFSVGIAQINLKSHTDITEKQARDVTFSAAFMAKAFSEGKQSMWSCYKALYKK